MSECRERKGASGEIEGSRDCERCSESVLPVIFMLNAPVTGEVDESFSRGWENVGVIMKKGFSSLNSPALRLPTSWLPEGVIGTD